MVTWNAAIPGIFICYFIHEEMLDEEKKILKIEGE